MSVSGNRCGHCPMRLKNRIKRIADIMEKLGVASLAIGLFQDKYVGVWLGVVCLVLALTLTREDLQ